jgi:hypothetical protein
MADLPVVCSLDPGALNARREGLVSELLRRARTREHLANGLRVSFATTDDTFGLIMRTVELERRCCRFLRFQITVEPDGGPVSVELTGPAGTREFLSSLFES